MCRVAAGSGRGPEGADRNGRTAFDAAAKIADPRDRGAIRMLLDSNFGQKVTQKEKGPRPGSPEYWVLRGQGDAVKMMLSLGADPTAPGTAGTTPLADAALKGDIEVVRALLARGARPNVVSPAAFETWGRWERAESRRAIDAAAHGGDDGEAECGGGADGAGSGFSEQRWEGAEGVGLTEIEALLRRGAAAK